MAKDIVEKSGSWFTYRSERLGQGRENAKTFLKANPDMLAQIEKVIRDNAAGVADAMMVGPSEEDDL